MLSRKSRGSCCWQHISNNILVLLLWNYYYQGQIFTMWLRYKYHDNQGSIRLIGRNPDSNQNESGLQSCTKVYGLNGIILEKVDI